MRAAMCVIVRDLIVFGVISDMMKGRPAVYATFSSYDEVAHHSGLERPERRRLERVPNEGDLERIVAETADRERDAVDGDHSAGEDLADVVEDDFGHSKDRGVYTASGD